MPIFDFVGRVFAALAAALAAAILAGPAASAGNPEIAALQVGLSSRGLYKGTVDGVLGVGTSAAIRRFQRKAGLPANGVPGPKTRAALGHYGRRAPLGRRTLVLGTRGWDVAALQFTLAWHGFPSGPLDGHLGLRTEAALRRFQVWAGLKADGTAGASTFAALRAPVPRSPLVLSVPVQAPTGDDFGPRGSRFHSGLDFRAPSGTPVSAAGCGSRRVRGPAQQRLGKPRRGHARLRSPDALRTSLANRREARRACLVRGPPGSRRSIGTSHRPAPASRGARSGRGRRPADGVLEESPERRSAAPGVSVPF